MRVFFAIEFSQEIKEYLYTLQQEIRKHCSGGNFSHKENFHLTLRFIGEQTTEQIGTLKRVLQTTAADICGFELKLDKLGSFNKGSKKIIWTGLERNNELQQLYQKLEGTLEKDGYPREERAYSPHVTLVREAKLEDSYLGDEIFSIKKLPIKVGSISLMESKRVENKLSYVAVDRVNLL